MERLQIRLVKNKSELERVFKIRTEVFVEGQDVPAEIEYDEFENISKHVIVIYRKRTIGCARIRPVNGKLKLERIAILDEYRGKKLGVKLMNYLVKYCKRKRVKDVYMHAQYYLRRFYEKFGFGEKGKIFYEAGIRHIVMHAKPRELKTVAYH
jgi:predicted GNAT family N-acyltransferase